MLTGTGSTIGVSIRAANRDDIDAWMDMLRACIRHMREKNIDQWDDIYPDRDTLERDVEAGSVYVGLIQGVLGGALVLSDYQEPEYSEVPWQYTGRVVVVHRLMVEPGVEGKGIGRTLMRFAETRAVSLGYSTLRLDAFSENPRALHFYKRLGYRDAGRVHFRKGEFHCFEKPLPRVG